MWLLFTLQQFINVFFLEMMSNIRHLSLIFTLSSVCRFKPLQKVDGMSDSLCGSSQNCNSTPEQSVAAQSQHHQQYIGKDGNTTTFNIIPVRCLICAVVFHQCNKTTIAL